MSTITKLKDSYIKALQEQKLECINQMEKLKQELREDEATFCKIRINIYEIFETLFASFEKRIIKKGMESDSECYKQFYTEYLATFDKIPLSWKTKLEYATKHNITEDIVVENAKLEVADSLKRLFMKALEGSES